MRYCKSCACIVPLELISCTDEALPGTYDLADQILLLSHVRETSRVSEPCLLLEQDVIIRDLLTVKEMKQVRQDQFLIDVRARTGSPDSIQQSNSTCSYAAHTQAVYANDARKIYFVSLY